MNAKKLLVSIAMLAAAGSTFAQQAEFAAPDAAFHGTRTRAEVRREFISAQGEGNTAQRRHDGQDGPRASSAISRLEVRTETARDAASRHHGNVNSLYFGA